MAKRVNLALLGSNAAALDPLRMTLEGVEWEVSTYTDSAILLEDLVEMLIDMVVYFDDSVDLNMDIIGPLRRVSTVPLVVITTKTDEMDEVLMLKLGVDMVVTLPYAQRLLLERINALLRRVKYEQEKCNGVLNAADDEIIQRGALLLDKARYLCKWKGQEVALTTLEFALISALARRPGIVKTRDALLTEIHTDDPYVEDRAIDSLIKRLRYKFKQVDENFENIETVYGAGYRYNLE
ncbi:MAG: response regulator transcription factor [Alphaproteobacteria bacterium]|nr:response regulator transcription factor [Alphaproteobacteria bacterium]